MRQDRDARPTARARRRRLQRRPIRAAPRPPPRRAQRAADRAAIAADAASVRGRSGARCRRRGASAAAARAEQHRVNGAAQQRQRRDEPVLALGTREPTHAQHPRLRLCRLLRRLCLRRLLRRCYCTGRRCRAGRFPRAHLHASPHHAPAFAGSRFRVLLSQVARHRVGRQDQPVRPEEQAVEHTPPARVARVEAVPCDHDAQPRHQPPGEERGDSEAARARVQDVHVVRARPHGKQQRVDQEHRQRIAPAQRSAAHVHSCELLHQRAARAGHERRVAAQRSVDLNCATLHPTEVQRR